MHRQWNQKRPQNSLNTKKTEIRFKHPNSVKAFEKALKPLVASSTLVPEMIEIIQQLIDRGHAYEVDNHVIFSVKLTLLIAKIAILLYCSYSCTLS